MLPMEMLPHKQTKYKQVLIVSEAVVFVIIVYGCRKQVNSTCHVNAFEGLLVELQ
jgi:hypothetical protein